MVALYITIDTEYEFGFTAHRGPASREDNFARAIRGATANGDAGIFYQMDVFDRLGLKAVFFVDPMPALLWGTRAIAEVVEPVLARGHDVQLHLHTEWLSLLGNANPLGSRTGGNLKDFTRDEQRVLIEIAIEQLVKAGAPRPVAFRAGNYGANDDTLRALADLGLSHDSSHPPGLAQSPCAIRLGPEHRRPLRRLGVIEVPIGCIADAFGGLRHAQITALSCREIVAALRHARENAFASFTVVSHSFELLSRRRTSINRIVQRRFEKICEQVARMHGVDTATFSQLLPRPTKRVTQAPVLAPAPLLNSSRMVEQAVANALYGRKSVPHNEEEAAAEPGSVAKALRFLDVANRTRIA